MSLSADDRELLKTARAHAERVLQSLQSDLAELPSGSAGWQVHQAAIDAARRTLNNLDRRLGEPAGPASHGRGSDPT